MASCKFDTDMDPEVNSIFEGYMFLHNKSLFRQWKFRPKYFILTPRYMYCFKRRGDLASIPRDVLLLQELSVSIDEEMRGLRRRYYLNVESSVQKKSFSMFCFSMEERNEWMTKILYILANNYLQGEPSNLTSNKTSYTSQSLPKISSHDVMQSIELTNQMSLSCMELTNVNFLQQEGKEVKKRVQKRQTISSLHFQTGIESQVSTNQQQQIPSCMDDYVIDKDDTIKRSPSNLSCFSSGSTTVGHTWSDNDDNKNKSGTNKESSRDDCGAEERLKGLPSSFSSFCLGNTAVRRDYPVKSHLMTSHLMTSHPDCLSVGLNRDRTCEGDLRLSSSNSTSTFNCTSFNEPVRESMPNTYPRKTVKRTNPATLLIRRLSYVGNLKRRAVWGKPIRTNLIGLRP